MHNINCLALSDTHNQHDQLNLDLSFIDLIIHVGDFTNSKSPSINHQEAVKFLSWFSELPVKHKILVPGNHETSWAAGYLGKIEDYWDIITLVNETKILSEYELEIYGSPVTPEFGSGWAWNCHPNKIKTYWNQIPKTTDLLLCHGPAKSILDIVPHGPFDFRQVGCPELLKRVKKVKPSVMISGHIHREGGRQLQIPGLNTKFINAACCDDNNKIVNDKGVYFKM